MFTLKEINNEVPVFNKFMNYISIPYFQSVIYDENMDACGKIKYEDISQNKYILYLSNQIDKFSIKRQKSIIWHEFTHCFDYLAYKDKHDIKPLLKSYSEYHATLVEMHYLTDTSLSEKVNDTNIFIDWEENQRRIVEINADLAEDFLKHMIVFEKTGEPKIFNHAVNQFLYFCGSISLQSKAILLFNKLMDSYPSTLFKNELISLGNAILHRNVQLAVKTYKNMFEQAQIVSINKFIEK